MIELKDITKSESGKKLLCGATLDVSDVGVCGVIGASRKSVSALLDIICGATAFDSGKATVCGYDMLTSPKKAQKRIGYLTYPAVFYEDMTAFEHLTFVGEAKSVQSDKLYKNIKSALELTETEGIADRLILRLTSSERRRLGIAAAMLGNPDVIVLDEPTSGMSKKESAFITELIKKLGKIKTVIVASSDIDFIEKACDSLVIISNGSIMASGSLSEISERLARNKALRLTVKGKEREVVDKLSSIKAITDCTVTSSGAGSVTLKVEYERGADIREDVFSLFASAGMPIIAMEEDHIGFSEFYYKLCESEKENGEEKSE